MCYKRSISAIILFVDSLNLFGLVPEGMYLRQSSLYKKIMPGTLILLKNLYVLYVHRGKFFIKIVGFSLNILGEFGIITIALKRAGI